MLSYLEANEGNRDAAIDARRQAVQRYRDYRRAGGENYNTGGRICLQFRQALEDNREVVLSGELEEASKHPQLPAEAKLLISKLQAILAGSRDPGMAQDEGLHYMDAAELMLLLEEMG